MSGSKELPALTGPRLFAAASIAIGHFGIADAYRPFGLVLDVTAFGMPLFFTRSGFIIHFVYAELFQRSWRPAVAHFSWARFSRLYPLYVVLLAYFWAFSPPFSQLLTDSKIAISFLTLTETWWYWQRDGHTIGDYAYGLSWSIATEWFFYFFYAAILYRVAHLRSARILVATLVALCIAVYALNFFLSTNLAEAAWLLSNIFPDAVPIDKSYPHSAVAWLVYISPYFHIWEFVGGVLTCQLYLILSRSGRVRHIGSPLFWCGLAWIAVPFLLYADACGPSSAISRLLMPAASQYIVFLHDTFLLAPGMLMMILGLACGNNVGASFMSLGVIVFGGEISYSIYLGQLFVGNLIYPTFSPGLTIALKFFALCIIASGLYIVVEMPAKRALRQLARATTGLLTPSRAVSPAE